MTKKYEEVVICGKCSNEYHRDMEIFQTTGKHLNLESPLNVIFIKKFECSHCKETQNYKIEIVEKKKKKEIV